MCIIVNLDTLQPKIKKINHIEFQGQGQGQMCGYYGLCCSYLSVVPCMKIKCLCNAFSIVSVVIDNCYNNYHICRYGRNGVDEYKKNLTRLFDRFKQTLPDDCLLVWNATLPISKNARGGFLVPEVEFMNSSLRLDILEANFYANQVMVKRLHHYCVACKA